MRNRTSLTKWNIFFHYATIIISIINGLVIVPFYLKFIDHALFGAWLATGNILAWLTIVEPGVGDVIQQKVASAYAAKEYKNASLYITSGIIISLIISIFVFLLSLIVQLFIAQILNLSPAINSKELLFAFQIAAIGTSFSMLSYAFVGANQGLQSSVGIGLIYLTTNITGIVTNVTLLFEGYGLVAIASAILINGIGLFIGNVFYLAYRLRKYHLGLNFNKYFFIDFAKLFALTFFSKISNILATNIDLVIVSGFINSETVTMLELTRRPIKIIQGFTNRISVAFMPALAHLKGEGDILKIKELFLKFFIIFSWVSVFIIFGFITFNKSLIAVWTGQNIFIGNSINILICVTLLLGSFTYNLSNFCFSLGNIKGNSRITVLKSIIYLVLIFFLGKFYGIFGILSAALISILFSEALYYPKRLIDLLSLTKSEILTILKENILLVTVGTIVSMAFYYLNVYIKNWFDLILYACIYSLYFWGLLTLVSSKFRDFFLKILIKKRG